MSTFEDIHDFEVSCDDCLEKKYPHTDIFKISSCCDNLFDNYNENYSNNSLSLNNDDTCCKNDFNKHAGSCCDDLFDNYNENYSNNSLPLNNDDTCCSDDFFNDLFNLLCNLCCNNKCVCNNIFIIRHHKKKRKFCG